MATVDRVLPWRRQHIETAASRADAAARRAIGAATRSRRCRHDQPGVPHGRRGPPQPDAIERRELHQPSAGRRQDRRRHRARRDRRSPPRCCTMPSRTPRSRSPTSSSDFGAEVAWIVDGVTKLERIRFDSREAQQAATMRKMLVAMAKDLRVLVIKLADRLHNMRTLAGDAAREAAAHRPGDARHLCAAGAPPRHPGDQAAARRPLVRRAPPEALRRARPPRGDAGRPSATCTSPRRVAEVRARLDELGIEAEVTGRGKHLWSIYEKMVVKGREFDEIFDIVAVRVIVDSIKDCYAALGIIHGRWRPVVGSVQGLHRDAEVQPLPEPAHDGDRAGRASRSRCRSAPARCTSVPSGASPRTGRTRAASDASRHRLAEPDHRLAGRGLRPGAVHGRT